MKHSDARYPDEIDADREANQTGALPPVAGSATFTARLAVTDGGEPIDLLDDDDGGFVYRGDEIVGTGVDLNAAWDDYLYSCHPAAPIHKDELAAMWVRFDAQNDPTEARP